MDRILKYIPEASGAEYTHLQMICQHMTEDQLLTFSTAYRNQRKDTNTFLILTLLGLLIISGIQRFYINQPLMGVLYFLTGGLCLIGTIYDAVSNKTLTEAYNIELASKLVALT